MTQKSRIMGIFLIALIAVSILGCSKTTQASVDGNSRDIKLLAYNNLTQANTAADWGWVIGTFRDNNPDISVAEETLYEEPFHQKTTVYSASGNIPDVLYVWPSGRSSTLHQNKQLKDLTRLVQRDGLQSQFTAAALDPAQQMGYLAMIPRTFTVTHTFLVNLEVLNAVGLQPAKTYAELKAQVPVLRARGYETLIMGNQASWVMQSCMIGMLLGRFTGDANWYVKIQDGTAKFTDPDYLAAFNFVKTMYDDGVLAASTLGQSTTDAVGLFANNRGAYFVNGDWQVADFITDASTGRALIPVARQGNIKVTVFPTIEGAKIPSRTTTAIAGTGWAMSAAIPDNSPREEAAWTLIKWLIGREVATLNLNHAAYSSSTRTDIRSSDLTLEPIQIAAANIGGEYDAAHVVFDGVFNDNINGVVNDVLQEIGLGSMTGQQAAAALQAAVDRDPNNGKP